MRITCRGGGVDGGGADVTVRPLEPGEGTWADFEAGEGGNGFGPFAASSSSSEECLVLEVHAPPDVDARFSLACEEEQEEDEGEKEEDLGEDSFPGGS